MLETSYCPNCGQPVGTGGRLCPHCGRELPPAPVLTGEAPKRQLVTRSAGGDVALGVLLTFVSALTGFGVAVMLVVYFVLRGSYPSFARGVGYTLLVFGALLLGLLALCFTLIAQAAR